MRVAFVQPAVRFARGTTASLAPAEALRFSHPLPQDVVATALALEPGFQSFRGYCVVFVERNPRLMWLQSLVRVVSPGRLRSIDRTW